MARAATILSLCALLLTACDNATTNIHPSGHAGSTPTTASFTTVALVTDSSDQSNGSFNQLASAGYLKASQHYGFTPLVIPATTSNDYLTNLTTAAGEADMVVAVGFFMQTPLDKVAKEFPNKKFAMVDGCAVPDPNTGACENLPNVAALFFNEQEAGCIVGALAAQMEVDGKTKLPKLLGKNTIGAVGSLPIPSINRSIAGYKYCARKVDPNINIVVGYSNDFTNPASCQAIANSQISEQQADIIFQVARDCGIGALDAATQKNVYSIGMDVDQSKDASGKVRRSVITSALKHVNTAVYDIINDAENNQYNAFVKKPITFDLAHDGIGFATPNLDVPPDAIARANEYESIIKAGTLILPS